MADGTKIEWTDATLNVVNGCSVISPGCANCFAMRAGGRNLPGHPSTGLTQPSKAGHVWTGDVRFNETALLQPLRWKRPRTIFWNAHGDLFHEDVPGAWIDRCFAVMALTPRHKHQVLTKRPARMRAYFAALTEAEEGGIAERREMIQSAAEQLGALTDVVSRWPLPNVWLGVSVEDQTRADERIPDLLATPAAVRFLSAEPLLGPVNFNEIPVEPGGNVSPLFGPLSGYCQRHYPRFDCGCERQQPRINWVIVGGESGPGARPMHPDWARLLRDQCKTAGVPFLFKQWGSCLPGNMDGEDERGHPVYEIDEEHCEVDYDDLGRGALVCAHAHDFIRFKHKRTGRLLDGQHHDGMPL